MKYHLKWPIGVRARCGVPLAFVPPRERNWTKSKKKFLALTKFDKCKGCERSLATDRS